MDRFERDGMVFHVRRGGPPDGDLVVLLHGFPQTSRAWTEVEPLLHERGLRTLAPDQRGYSSGARPRSRRRYDLGDVATDVVALLDQAGADTAHVVGHDWGGAVAWWLGFHHPDRVASLTVLSTPHPRAMARSLVSSRQLLRSSYMAFFQLPRLPEWLLNRHGGERDRLTEYLVGTGCDADHAAEYAAAMSEPGALTAALNWYRALPFQRPSRLPGTISVPTRYLWGEDDPFLGRRAAELTARYVDGDYKFVPVPSAGHWLPETRPGHVAAAVAQLTGRRGVA